MTILHDVYDAADPDRRDQARQAQLEARCPHGRGLDDDCVTCWIDDDTRWQRRTDQ